MRITIRDLAKYCNVSDGTVDRALNNRFGISEKTKAKVLAAAKELHYYPNYTGRSLVTGVSMTIGIVCFDLNNNFFPQLIDTIESCAKAKGYFIHLILTHKDLLTEQEGLEYLFRRQVDGIILFPIGVGQEYLNSLNRIAVPTVTIYNKLTDDFPFVCVHDRKAIEDAVGFIAHKGYQKVVYLSPPIEPQLRQGHNVYSLVERKTGYVDGMKRYFPEIPCTIYEAVSLSDTLEEIEASLKASEKTALLCSHDMYAVSALDYFTNKGLSIPDDLGIMGFDDIEILRYIKPRLSTIQYSVSKMGEKVFDVLYELMQENEQRTDTKVCLLDYQIVEGQTI